MELPVELIRQIAETAVLDDCTTGPALALTCKDVNEWVTPLLYETVILTRDNVRAFIRGVEAAQCGPVDTGAYVKRLCIHQDAMQHCDWTLSLCRCVIHLLLCPLYWDTPIEDDSVAETPLWPTPTHITVLPMPRMWFQPRLPLFSRVTHLYFNDVPDETILTACSVLPLTHICFSVWGDALLDYALTVGAVQYLLQSSTMQCVLIHALVHGAPINDFFGGIWGFLATISDERFVVAPGMTRDQLIECFEEGQTIWSNLDEWRGWRQTASPHYSLMSNMLTSRYA